MIYSAKLPRSVVERQCGVSSVGLALEMRATGFPWDAIKAETGLNNRQLVSILPPTVRKVTNRIPSAIVAEIVRMRKNGHTYPVIAQATGVGLQTPRKICRKLFDDLELERTRSLAAQRRIPAIHPTRADTYCLIKELRHQGLPYRKIGKIVSMTAQGVMSVVMLHMPIEIEEVVAAKNKEASRFQPGVDTRRNHKDGCNCPVCRIRLRGREKCFN